MNTSKSLHLKLHQLFEGTAMQVVSPEDACNQAAAAIVEAVEGLILEADDANHGEWSSWEVQAYASKLMQAIKEWQ